MKNNKVTKIIWIICILIILGIIGMPKLYQGYHSAPYYELSTKKIVLEGKNVHKLNPYQKKQFTKIAKRTIDQRNKPLNWQKYRINLLNVYKLNKKQEYKIVLVIESTSQIRNTMIIKLHNRNLIDPYDFSIKSYSSMIDNGDK